jgi:hypothetical protein
LRSRIWLILIVLAMVAFTIWASGPVPPKDAELTPTATTAVVTPKAGEVVPTPVVEIIEKTPTTGVIYGGVIVMLILVIGVLISVRTIKN